MALLNGQQKSDNNNKLGSNRELRATKVPVENLENWGINLFVIYAPPPI